MRFIAPLSFILANPYFWAFCAAGFCAGFFWSLGIKIKKNVFRRHAAQKKRLAALGCLCGFAASLSPCLYFAGIGMFSVLPLALFGIISSVLFFLLFKMPVVFGFVWLAVLTVALILFLNLSYSWLPVSMEKVKPQPFLTAQMQTGGLNLVYFKQGRQRLLLPNGLQAKGPFTAEGKMLAFEEPWWFWFPSRFVYIAQLRDRNGTVVWRNPSYSFLKDWKLRWRAGMDFSSFEIRFNGFESFYWRSNAITVQ